MTLLRWCGCFIMRVSTRLMRLWLLLRIRVVQRTIYFVIQRVRLCSFVPMTTLSLLTNSAVLIMARPVQRMLDSIMQQELQTSLQLQNRVIVVQELMFMQRLLLILRLVSHCLTIHMRCQSITSISRLLMLLQLVSTSIMRSGRRQRNMLISS